MPLEAYTPPAAGAELIARMAPVDGLGSGLDADLVRGSRPDGVQRYSLFGAMPAAGQVPRTLRPHIPTPPAL